MVEADWPLYAPPVRQALDHFEAEITERMRSARIATRPVTERHAFVQSTVGDLLDRLRRLRTA
jgi:hypothetical protein